MTIPYFKTHCDSAETLYRQRDHLQKQPLIDAHFVARQEQLLFTHLHVLAHSEQPAAQPGNPVHTFICLMQQLLSSDEQRRQQGEQLALDCLVEGGDKQQGAFHTLALLPNVCKQERLLELYNSHPSLRVLLFQLWQTQQSSVPSALTSVAELRSADPQLQLAALNYAASLPDTGRDLFTPYFQGVISGSNRPESSGHLVATALWGALLRGANDLDKPLWRCIESESDSEALYHLLRLGAIMADPELIPVIQQYAKQHPQRSCELLALHGTPKAIDTLLSLSSHQEASPCLQAAWQWISGHKLAIAPKLQLVTDTSATPQQQNTIHRWWETMRDQLQPQDRLLMGKKITRQHVHEQALLWSGEFSQHLLDLLSFLQKRPIGVSAKTLQISRQTILQSATQSLAS